MINKWQNHGINGFLQVPSRKSTGPQRFLGASWLFSSWPSVCCSPSESHTLNALKSPRCVPRPEAQLALTAIISKFLSVMWFDLRLATAEWGKCSFEGQIREVCCSGACSNAIVGFIWRCTWRGAMLAEYSDEALNFKYPLKYSKTRVI